MQDEGDIMEESEMKMMTCPARGKTGKTPYGENYISRVLSLENKSVGHKQSMRR